MKSLSTWAKQLVVALLLALLPALPSAALSAPSAVTPESSSSANTALNAASVKVTWQQVTASDVVGYSVFAVSGNLSIAGSTPSCQINQCVSFVSDLTGGTQYSFVVSAINSNGASSDSAPVSFTAVSSPGAPTQLAAAAASGQVTLTWSEPNNIGGLSLLDYEITGENGFSRTVPSTATSSTVTGLNNGTAYVFQIRARNSNGYSATASFQAATPVGVPGTPARPTVTSTSNAVTVTWVAPNTGGSPITGYKARLFRSGVQVAANDGLAANLRNHTFNNLPAGNYTVRVIATNAQGDSATSPESAQISVGTILLAQTITFQQPTAQNFPGALTLSASADSQLALSFQASGSCNVDSATKVVTFTGPGVCEIVASQAGNGTYSAADPVTRSFSIQQTQTSSSGGVGGGGGTGGVSIPVLTPTVSSISQEFLPTSNSLRLRIQGQFLDLVSSLGIGSVSATIVSKAPGLLVATLPVPGVGSYDITLGFSSQSILIPGALRVAVDYLSPKPTSSSTVSNSASVSPGNPASRISIGTFKGFVAIYFSGYRDARAALKLAGKWVLIPKINADYFRVVRKTGSGYLVKAEVFIDKKLVEKRTLVTR